MPTINESITLYPAGMFPSRYAQKATIGDIIDIPLPFIEVPEPYNKRISILWIPINYRSYIFTLPTYNKNNKKGHILSNKNNNKGNIFSLFTYNNNKQRKILYSKNKNYFKKKRRQ